MGKTFAYNTGESTKAKDELNLRFGMFFDGTLNNKNNTDLRIKYRNGGQGPASGKEAKPVYTQEEQESIDNKLEKDTTREENRYWAMKAGHLPDITQEEKDYLIAAHRGDFINWII